MNRILTVMCLSLLMIGTAFSQTFSDDFAVGKLDTSKWIASNWKAPGNKPGLNAGTFSPANLDFSQGMLCIKLTQTKGQQVAVNSSGGEIQSKDVFGYGTYTFVMRVGSTATTPTGPGKVVSGSDSGGFTFINNSQTELDIEFLGDTPGSIWLTNWNNAKLLKKPVDKQASQVSSNKLADAFYTYTIVWTPGQVVWYLNGARLATHTKKVPTAPAHILINHWGTNSNDWGGQATVGVTRYLYVKSVSFTPMGATK